MKRTIHASFVLIVCLVAVTRASWAADGDLPAGVMRGPLLHEHSFQAPLVDDWWEEGVPHFMIGGSAIANENFLRLTTNSLDDHGFAFNTAPMDHDNWEMRLKISVRPPPPAFEAGKKAGIEYQGGDGLALWYLSHPIGDDHQHVIKYSKSLSPEVVNEIMDMENPWRVADQLLNTDDEDDGFDDDVDEQELTEKEKKGKAQAKARSEQKRKRREELFRRLFKRGTSVDDSDHEQRIMGVKYSDFLKGFAIILDSVGDETSHIAEHKEEGNAAEHHHHKPSISVLLNLPNHTRESGATIVNNFSPMRDNFRISPKLLHCEYDFRQDGSRRYDPQEAAKDPLTRAQEAPEEPVELIVRYYKKKLSIIIRREYVSKREVSFVKDTPRGHTPVVDVRRTYRETLCGELYPLTIPLKYHFGLSASTGHRPRQEKRRNFEESVFHHKDSNTKMHVDVHDVYRLELRELGLDAKAMGYSKTIPLEHFDYEGDRKEREHFSRQIPVKPDADDNA